MAPGEESLSPSSVRTSIAYSQAVIKVGSVSCALAAVLFVPGCVPDDGEGRALEPRLVFGSIGRSLGQFSYPRAISVDMQRDVVYVVDKSARVQRFGLDGEPQIEWRMPEWANGKPVGLTVAGDGTVWVADTHYHRVIRYDADGRELLRFGSYGTGQGEFIYPTDIAFGPDGRVYVGEYGGNDRIQVFDSGGSYLFEFGALGSEPGQFNRPQALAFGASQRELYVADACNHRISVHDPEGRLLRVFGSVGRDTGELAYPYDVMVLADETVLVCEFGNNRIQRFTPHGAPKGVYGRVGTGEGELQYPWGVDGTDRALFVLDSGNNRVQVIRVR
jgi:DNA-binding beta-propeller fold protein YncE